MPKVAITSDRVQIPQTGPWNGLSRDEVVAAVCKYFCLGHTAVEVRNLLRQTLGVKLTREEPLRMLSYAGKHGWLQFCAPVSFELSDRLQGQYPALQKAIVVRTAVSDDIGYHMAKLLLDVVRRRVRERPQKRTVHVGFAGGRLLRKTARHFAEMLREATEDLPEVIVFHAMVGGAQYAEVASDPNAFFVYFLGDPPLQVKTKFVVLHAPGLVRTSKFDGLREMDHIREAFEAAQDIDIIVTSAGGHWQEGHSTLYHMYRSDSPRSLDILNREGCVGDMMWRPLGPKGPIEVRTEVRAMTLMELSDLPAFIARGRFVLALVGPCGYCGGPKPDVLKVMLNSHGGPLCTHVVTDSRSAAGCLGIARQ